MHVIINAYEYMHSNWNHKNQQIRNGTKIKGLWTSIIIRYLINIINIIRRKTLSYDKLINLFLIISIMLITIIIINKFLNFVFSFFKIH